MTQQGQGDAVERSGEWTFTDCLKVAQTGYGEWALNPRNDPATEHLAGAVIISDMMACIAEAFRRALADAPLSSSRGEQGWRTIDSAPKDGTEVQGWREDSGPILVRWTSAGDFLTDAEAEESGMTEEQLYEESWFYADFVQGGRLAADEYPTHWMPLPSAPGSVPTSDITTVNNSALRKLADVWELDGDLMRCRGCGRALIASRDGEQLHHSAECKHSERGHPWAELRNLLGSVPTSLAGQGPDGRKLKRGDRVIRNGQILEFIESELEGDKFVVIGAAPQPTAGGDAPGQQDTGGADGQRD